MLLRNHSSFFTESGKIGVLHLSLTGRPSLGDDFGRTIRFPRKAFILAAFLALDEQGLAATRRRAAEFLWDDMDPVRRAGNLRQLRSRLGRLQEAEGFELFRFDKDAVQLGTTVEVDVFELTRRDVTAVGREILLVCDAWSGELLLGFEDGTETYRGWLREMRNRLRELFVSLVARELDTAARVLTPDECLRVAGRLLDADPESETAFRVLIRTHFDRGDRAAVERLSRRLERAHPGGEFTFADETRDLLEEIRHDRKARSPVARVPDVGVGGTRDEATSARFSHSPCLFVASPDFVDAAVDVRHRCRDVFDEIALRIWQTRVFTLVRPAGADTDWSPLTDFSLNRRSDYAITARPMPRGANSWLIIELSRPRTGEILWIHEVDPHTHDPYVAQRVVLDCIRHIERYELGQPPASTREEGTYRATLRAKYILREIDLQSIRKARQILKETLKIDPAYAAALAIMAKTHRLEWLRLARADDEEHLDTALVFARRAITADPDAGVGEHQLGTTSLYKKDYDFALKMLARAEGLLPNEEEIIADHADVLFCAGALSEGYEKIAPLLESPFSLSDHTLWIAASGLYLLGRYQDAIRLLDGMSARDSGHQLRAACHAMLSQFEDARRYVAKTREVLPEFNVAARLCMVPIRRKEDLDHYREGLIRAGFD